MDNKTKNTTKTYSDILSAYLNSMDETELIKRKKGIPGKGGDSPDT